MPSIVDVRRANDGVAQAGHDVNDIGFEVRGIAGRCVLPPSMHFAAAKSKPGSLRVGIAPYIYLLPAIALLGYATDAGLIATLIVALPPALCLTPLGIRMTSDEFIALGNATSVKAWQISTKVHLPFAMPDIMAGISRSS